MLRSGVRAIISVYQIAEDRKDYSKYAEKQGMWVLRRVNDNH